MPDGYDWAADALGSYNVAMREIGDKVKETGVVPDCLLGTGEHTKRLLEEREKTHGPFCETAWIAQRTRTLWHSRPGWERLSDVKREVLDMYAVKVARILAGDPDNPDHWEDLSGYAGLGRRDCD